MSHCVINTTVNLCSVSVTKWGKNCVANVLKLCSFRTQQQQLMSVAFVTQTQQLIVVANYLLQIINLVQMRINY